MSNVRKDEGLMDELFDLFVTEATKANPPDIDAADKAVIKAIAEKVDSMEHGERCYRVAYALYGDFRQHVKKVHEKGLSAPNSGLSAKQFLAPVRQDLVPDKSGCKGKTMNKKAMIAVIQTAATTNGWTAFTAYSGKMMKGKTCLAVILPYPMLNGELGGHNRRAIKTLVDAGVAMPKWDTYGNDTVVYWPNL